LSKGNEGEVVEWSLVRESIPRLKEILENEVRKLKFTPFDCVETQTV